MNLTSAQKCVLRVDMDTHPELASAVATGDLVAIADFYNAPAPGGETCWRPQLPLDEVTQAMDWTEYQALSRSVQATFELLIRNNVLESGLSNVRAGLNDIFSGPQQANTRGALIAAAQRVMTRAELLFADTAASPATLLVEGDVSSSDVLWALTNC